MGVGGSVWKIYKNSEPSTTNHFPSGENPAKYDDSLNCIIKWSDSVGITDKWESIDDIEKMKPHVRFSAGFLIDDDNFIKHLRDLSALEIDSVGNKFRLQLFQILVGKYIYLDKDKLNYCQNSLILT